MNARILNTSDKFQNAFLSDSTPSSGMDDSESSEEEVSPASGPERSIRASTDLHRVSDVTVSSNNDPPREYSQDDSSASNFRINSEFRSTHRYRRTREGKEENKEGEYSSSEEESKEAVGLESIQLKEKDSAMNIRHGAVNLKSIDFFNINATRYTENVKYDKIKQEFQWV